LNTEVTIGLLSAVVALAAALHAAIIQHYTRVRVKQERARELFADFYSADHYRRVVAPVFRITLKWKALPPEKRDEYRRALCYGWIPHPDPEVMMRAYVSPERLEMSAMEAHFRDVLPLEQFTEHESLTSFLYFFTQSERLIATGLVEPKLFAALFCKSFSYYWEFLSEMRAMVIEMANGDGARSELPSWVSATQSLERLIRRHAPRGEGSC